ncbi:MAG: sarcosine oxidase subunit beta family protein [Alphaproteobacteria bacterium]|nr:sarcosine oxidase subunit beta family protein [Alphaproteobacteria bacterium]
MSRYSFLSLLRNGLNHHRRWPQAWRSPAPKPAYDVVVIGAGGHGLATAYYLAAEHGIANVAVVDKGWLGGGNTGRNTTIVRSNYLYPESAAFYDFALRLYERLSDTLNYNIMLSQRGLITLAHSRHELEAMAAWVNAMQVNGVDAEAIGTDEIRRMAPLLDCSTSARFPVLGGALQRRAGIARHDAVAWAYARAADARGVDIIQNCEVHGLIEEAGRIVGVETARGPIRAGKVVMAVAGHSSVLAAKAGFRLPVTSYALQAMVSEPVKPMLDVVLLSPATGVYVSQSDKGELVFGGGLDLYPSYGQRGNFPTVETVIAGLIEMFPGASRLRWMRQWAGITDVVHDSSPIIDRAPKPGLYINCGWGTGGFKAIPAGGFTTAHLVARDEPHPLASAFTLKRFETGAMIDEAAAAGISH